MSKTTTLVVGGAGYIGSHTVRFLASQDRDVLVLDNLIYGHRDALVDESVRFIQGSLSDRPVLDKIFSENDIDVVLHFAAYINVGESVTDPLKYYQNNTADPVILLEAMRDHGVKSFVLSSTAAVYGEPIEVPIAESHPLQPVNPYGWSKLMLEQILTDCDTAWGLKSVCLRYFNASGSWGDGLIGEAHDPETHLIPNVLLAIQGKIEAMTVLAPTTTLPMAPASATTFMSSTSPMLTPKPSTTSREAANPSAVISAPASVSPSARFSMPPVKSPARRSPSSMATDASETPPD